MKKLTKIFSMLILIGIAVLVMLMIVPLISGKKILIGHVSAPQLFYGTSVVMLLLCIAFVIFKYTQHKCGKNLAIMIFGSAISTIALLGGSLFYLLFLYDSEVYYTFYSPDRKYSVVVEEWSWLLAGSVTVYERTNPFLVEFKENMITDDGFRPISADAYEIQWDDNVVTLTIETMDWDRGKDSAVVALRVKK